MEVAKREDGAKWVLPFHDWTFPRGSKVDLRRRDDRRGEEAETVPSVTAVGGCWGWETGAAETLEVLVGSLFRDGDSCSLG